MYFAHAREAGACRPSGVLRVGGEAVRKIRSIVEQRGDISSMAHRRIAARHRRRPRRNMARGET